MKAVLVLILSLYANAWASTGGGSGDVGSATSCHEVEVHFVRVATGQLWNAQYEDMNVNMGAVIVDKDGDEPISLTPVSNGIFRASNVCRSEGLLNWSIALEKKNKPGHFFKNLFADPLDSSSEQTNIQIFIDKKLSTESVQGFLSEGNYNVGWLGLGL